jgi:hypothetical protein
MKVPDVIVIRVSYEETLGCEGVGLNVDIGVGDIVDERTFTYVGKPSDQQSSLVRVYAWQSRHMFPHFFQIPQ